MGTTLAAREQWEIRRGRHARRSTLPARVAHEQRPPIITAVVDDEPSLTRLERAQLRRDALALSIQQLPGADQVQIEQQADRLYYYMTGDGASLPPPLQPALPAPATSTHNSAAVTELIAAVAKDVAYWKKARVNGHLIVKYGPLLDAVKR